MKRYALTALVLVSSFGFASLGSAQALFGEPNVTVDATFYRGSPEGQNTVLSEARLNNSPVAVAIPNLDRASYVVLEHDGQSYTFEVAEGGTNKNTVELLISEADTMTLSEVVAGLADDPTLLEQLSS